MTSSGTPSARAASAAASILGVVPGPPPCGDRDFLRGREPAGQGRREGEPPWPTRSLAPPRCRGTDARGHSRVRRARPARGSDRRRSAPASPPGPRARATSPLTRARSSRVSMPYSPKWSSATFVITATSARRTTSPRRRSPPRAVSSTAAVTDGSPSTRAAPRGPLQSPAPPVPAHLDPVGGGEPHRVPVVPEHGRKEPGGRGLPVGAGDQGHRRWGGVSKRWASGGPAASASTRARRAARAAAGSRGGHRVERGRDRRGSKPESSAAAWRAHSFREVAARS
jgi:hypothetical protein